MEFRPNPLLYGAHEGFLSSFKLVVTLRDTVDHGSLTQAVHKAMKRYPYFSVYPQKTGKEIRLQWNEAPVPVWEHGDCAVQRKKK